MNTILHALRKRLQPTIRTKDKVARRQVVNRMDLQAIKAKIEILEMMVDTFHKNEHIVNDGLKSFALLRLILGVLLRADDSITDQEIADLTLEIQRLIRSVQFEKIQQCPGYPVGYSSKQEVKALADKIQKSIDNKNR